MNSQSMIYQLSGPIGNFIIWKQLSEITRNELYLVHKNTMENNSLFILKKYNDYLEYSQELKVLQLTELYKNVFVCNCDHMVYKGNIFQYVVCHYSKLGSLYEFGSKVKQFPLETVKFYMHSLFSQLRAIYQSVNIKFHPLYHTDVIFSQDFKLFMVGWSKIQSEITQSQLIYDCAQIMYYMITNSIPQQKSFFISKEKKRFLSEEYWDTSKMKQPYLKYLPKQQKQINKWVGFLKYITTNPSVTFKNVLSHQFFNERITQKQACQILKQKYLQKLRKQIKKYSKDFQFKYKIDQEIKRVQKDGTRTISNKYQRNIIFPITIYIQNDKDDQKFQKTQNYPKLLYKISSIKFPQSTQPNNEMLCIKKLGKKKKIIMSWIYRFLDWRLSLGLKTDSNQSNDRIFDENWVELIDYKLCKKKSVFDNEAKFNIKCQFNFTQREGMLPDSEQVSFQLIVYLEEKKQNMKCIKGYKIKRMEEKMHEILQSEFIDYISQGLSELLVYSCRQ